MRVRKWPSGASYLRAAAPMSEEESAMKFWVLVGFFSAAAIPMAAASESSADCQVDDTRPAVQQRADAPPPAPPANAARPTLAQGAETPARPELSRRRTGKRIPDAELIGPRGTL